MPSRGPTSVTVVTLAVHQDERPWSPTDGPTTTVTSPTCNCPLPRSWLPLVVAIVVAIVAALGFVLVIIS